MFTTRLLLSLCLVLVGTLITLHASVIPYAMWQGDEYDYFFNQSQTGSQFFWHRLLFWSPRPLSEAFIALYGLCVAHFHAPLIGPVLSLIWGACAALAFIPTLMARTIPFITRLFFIALSVVLVFLGHPVADLMFWPMATIAHLPVLAAVFCIGLATLTNTQKPWLTALCLSIAATSSEVGFFFTGSYLVITAALALIKRAPPSRTAHILWVPALLCGFVSWRLIAGRIGLPHPHNTPTQGAFFASLHASISPLRHNLTMLQPTEVSTGGVEGGTLLHGFLLKGLVALSSFAALRAARITPSRRMLSVLMLSLVLTTALVIASAFYEFGFLCCQRHETLRLDFSLMLAMLVGGYLTHYLPSFRLSGPTLMRLACCGCLFFAVDTARWRYKDMKLFLQSRPLEAQARNSTWQSGNTPGDTMVMHQGTDSPIFYYWPWEPGHYAAGGPGWDVQSMMKFFNKKSLTVLPPVPVSIPTRTH